MRKTVVVCLDAFRHDYLKETRFLKSFGGEHGSGTLQPVLGFRANPASFLTGRMPREHGLFTEFWRPGKGSSLRGLRHFALLEGTVFDRPFRQFSRYALNGLRLVRGQTHFSSIEKIPFRCFGEFDFALQKNLADPGCLNVPTLFDFLRERGKRFLYLDWPVAVNEHGFRVRPWAGKRDSNQVDALLAKKDLHDFFYLHVWDLDSSMHAHGVHSRERRETLNELDFQCERIVNAFGEDCNYLFWGDHGAVDVSSQVDVGEAVRGLDVSTFLDSTMARFWVKDNVEERALRERLAGLPGRIVEREEQVSYGIDFPHTKYFDILFLVEPGCLVLPNYFQGETPVKGMHGYAPGTEEQLAGYATNLQQGERRRHITEFFSLLQRALTP